VLSPAATGVGTSSCPNDRIAATCESVKQIGLYTGAMLRDHSPVTRSGSHCLSLIPDAWASDRTN